MKQYFRVLAALLLLFSLCTFSLWRTARLPDLDTLTAAIGKVSDKFTAIKENIAEKSGGDVLLRRPTSSGTSYPEYATVEEMDADLSATLCAGIAAHEAEINVESFGISTGDFADHMARFTLSHPELFYVDGAFQYSYSTTTGKVTTVQPHYLYDKATADAMIVTYESDLAAIIAGAPAGDDDFAKLLYLHDYFVKYYTYDYSATPIRDAYSFFQQKTGVCQAYMLAYIATTRALGIESIPVTSSSMNHAWNLVKLGDAWYHVDVTWDDTQPLPSMTSYRYFLQSDQGIRAIDEGESQYHHDWQATQSASDARYDAAAWRLAANTPMCKLDGVYYCVLTEENSGKKDVYGAIYAGSDVTNLVRKHAVRSVWKAGVTSYYTDCYAGLGVYGNKIVFNTGHSLWLYTPETDTESQLIGSFVADTGSIYGILEVSEGGRVEYVVANSASPETYQVRSYQIAS